MCEKRYSEAETLLRDTLAAKLKTLGPDHRSTLVTKGNLAETLGDEGKNAEAEQLIRETLESERRALGPDHSDTLVTLGKRDEASSNLEFAFAHQAKSDLRQGVEKDEDLRSLRGDVRFVALAAKAQQGLAAAAKN